MKKTLIALAKRLGHGFADEQLLELALTHRSAAGKNNERLEVLGDGALNFIIAAELFRLRPELPEGDLSRLRATLVRGQTLAEVAGELALADLLTMGEGELRSGGFQRGSIQADAVEAIIGAIYLDAGFEACQKVVLALYQTRLDNLPDVSELKDPKTRLQERLQGRGRSLPIYELKDSRGKPHEQVFTVRCTLDDASFTAIGEGSSRRRAEQVAATEMLKQLDSAGEKA